MRYETPAPPAELGQLDGLAYSLWLPEGDPWAGVVVLHGARSCKESHHDFARAARSAGLSAVCFDQRGHGETGGELDGRVLDDVAKIATLLGDVPLALRGSSMGGYLAILAAERLDARAVAAICPASSDGLWRGLRSGELEFPADVPSLEAFLAEHPLDATVEHLAVPLLLMHAEGDEQVPAAHSRELARRSPDPRTELVIVPGGHHRSVQHDAELQGHALRWLRRVIAP
jgi:alpha-beta hydrolase superfamily lysophospholipase